MVGVAMRLAPDAGGRGEKRRGTCCSHDDFEDARRVSERMGFPFYVVDLRVDFGARVIGNFVSEYLAGRTPNPCVMCNREIKFDRLWSRARALEADFVATGHYARIHRDAAGLLSSVARRRLVEGSVLLSFHARTDRTLAHAVSARRHDQDRSSCARARAWAERTPTSPRARKSVSSPTATTRDSSSATRRRARFATDASSTREGRSLPTMRDSSLHRRPAPRPWRSGRCAALCSRNPARQRRCDRRQARRAELARTHRARSRVGRPVDGRGGTGPESR